MSEVGVPSGFTNAIDRVLRLERLREVNALLGFTRSSLPMKALATKLHPEHHCVETHQIGFRLRSSR